MDPLPNALRIAMVDHAVAIKRCLGLFSRPAQQATKVHLTERFETTYAPELEFLASGVPGSSMRSPTGSWLAHDSPSLAALSAPSRPSVDDVQPSRVTSSDSRHTRHDKTRLSLTFRKRSSAMADQHAQSQGGATRSTDGNCDELLPTHSKESSNRQLTSLEDTSTAHHNGQNLDASTPSQRSMSSERHETTRSDQSFGEKVGSVKKRLSLLSIGKKVSKNSVKETRSPRSVAEE
ncbi:Deoxycytidine kinase 1 [Coniosporium tulheliwenetii]|uniref:Deoxycytidine kinase 1 n=1 Tax=Coniosporium tulheliwenetii TaxID=3383036 RepID=A0ACC2ZP83_9PEZI|nr:Deoxycytidine kinase 1 [Cladosporium sp. JES 115]